MVSILTVAGITLAIPWVVSGLGMSISPVRAGDVKKYSSRENLFNCVSYSTVADDVAMVRVITGDRMASQSLDLHVFDDEGNMLRLQKDISNEVSFMFNNLNNHQPISTADEDPSFVDSFKRSGLFNLGRKDKDVPTKEKPKVAGSSPLDQDITPQDKEKVNEILNSHSGKSLVYICFDNLYSDKSWSFQPANRDIELYIKFRTLSTLKDTNYNNYAQYFSKLETAEDNAKNKVSKAVFTEEDFDKHVDFISSELRSVSEELHNSELILNNLMEQEYKLRDVNEAIFSEYTKRSIILLSCILAFGLFQLLYFRGFLKRKNLL